MYIRNQEQNKSEMFLAWIIFPYHI